MVFIDGSSTVAAYPLTDSWVFVSRSPVISRVHEQPVVAQKVYADDGRLNISYNEMPLKSPS